MDKDALIAAMEERAYMARYPMYKICQDCGISPSTFYRWKRGSQATIDKINKLNARLDDVERALA